MQKSRAISLILACTLGLATVSGCDFFRRLAGRPTSEDIAVRREEIRREQAAHQARLDSLKRIEKAAADSLEMLDRLKDSGEMMLPVSSLRRADTKGLGHRYYIIVGAFSDAANAAWLAERIEKSGYEVAKIPYGNGFTAIGAAGTDSLAGLWENLGKVRAEEFCPKDIWVLVNN